MRKCNTGRAKIYDCPGKKCVAEHPSKRRDCHTHEQQFAPRMKTAVDEFYPLMRMAVSSIHTVHGPGQPHALTFWQRVKLLLKKQLAVWVHHEKSGGRGAAQ